MCQALLTLVSPEVFFSAWLRPGASRGGLWVWDCLTSSHLCHGLCCLASPHLTLPVLCPPAWPRVPGPLGDTSHFRFLSVSYELLLSQQPGCATEAWGTLGTLRTHPESLQCVWHSVPCLWPWVSWRMLSSLVQGQAQLLAW